MADQELLLSVEALGKVYELYDRPHQRFLAYFHAGMRRKRRDFTALEGVDFRLHRGETLGVVGRNGSGKSTLLQLICGTLAPSSGTVQSHGRIAALLELGAGFNPEFTGRENAILNASIHGLSQAQIAERLDAIIEFSGIGEFIDQPVQHYSSGMFVRLAFAVIAHVDADILIIDEALAVGDALFAQKCMRFLEDFRRRGALLFVSHDAGAVTRLCDTALWLEHGRQMLLGNARTVTERYLEHLYSEQQDTSLASCDADEDSAGGCAQWLGERVEPWHDARTEWLRGSNLRNDIEVIKLDAEAEDFGTGLVRLQQVQFRDAQGRRLSGLIGGARVWLEVVFEPQQDMERLIVGFLFKNRLGQVLFGDNNALLQENAPVRVAAGHCYRARFEMGLPYLPEGEYVIAVSVSSGFQHDHVMHCWRHDALVCSVVASHVVHGLMGIPIASFDIAPLEDR